MRLITKIIALLESSDVPLSQIQIADRIDRGTSVVYENIRNHRSSGALPRIYVALYGQTKRGQRSPFFAIGNGVDAPRPEAISKMLLKKRQIGQFGCIDEERSRAAKIASQDKVTASLLPALRAYAGNPFGLAMAQCGVRA